MDAPSPSIRDLARKLLAADAHAQTGVPAPAVFVVNERLRVALTRVAGAHGFASLLRRALVLACTEVPALARVTVTAEGRLEGFEGVARLGPDVECEAAAAVTSHLLWLLVTFIGEPLTYRLVREAWPGIQPDPSLPERGRP